MPFPRRHFDRPCEQCGKPFWPTSTFNRFCSRQCSAAAQVKPRELCAVCAVKARKRGMFTCGFACGYKHRKLRTRKPRPCPRCGTDFMPRPSALARGAGKYCSNACYRAVQAARPAFLDLTCHLCGVSYRRTRAAVRRNKHNFCSRICAQRFNTGENSAQWRGGSDPNRGQGWRKLAEEMRVRDGRRCRRCGKTEAENGQLLSVDHIIPWRSFDSETEANDPANLASLCRPCHSAKGRAERLWLKGDVLDMWRYQVAVAQPWVDRSDPVQLPGTA